MTGEQSRVAEGGFHVTEIAGSEASGVQLVWGHGWGQSGASFRGLAEGLKPLAPSWLLDFPGFGAAALPPKNWGTAEYADAASLQLERLRKRRGGLPLVWVGHSFGGRVGLQLAARHGGELRGMVLIASAGLPRHRPALLRARLALQRKFLGTAKWLLRDEGQVERFRSRLGSSDYRNAGAMRPVFTRVVNEDLSDVARHVKCPTLLIYGRKDTETPPEMGERLRTLIPGAELTILDNYGHLDILTEGRHQVALQIRRFLESRVTPGLS